MLRECVAEQEATHGQSGFARERMQDLLEMLEMLITWYEQMRRLSPASQRRVLTMGNKLTKIVGEVQPARKRGSA
jgi:hypothetical protein